MPNDTIRRGVDFLLGQTNEQKLRKLDRELALVNRLADEMSSRSEAELRAMSR